MNLIGGLNNSGKTVLLEALLLNLTPNVQNIATIRQLRGEDMDTKELPEYTWDNFFINQDKSKKIEITTTHNAVKKVALSIDCNEETDDFKKDEQDSNGEDFEIMLNDFISNEQALKSVLHLKYKIDDGNEFAVLSGIAHQKGFSFKELKIPTYIKANYIPASSRRKAHVLARDYGIAEKRGVEMKVLEALKIIDKKIEAIRVSVVGGVHIEIKRENEKYISLSLFGDAINKILNIVLTLVNNKGSVLLIDEIENGIHYTAQKDFWHFLFALASSQEFDVQVFATTHSLEMMEAFSNTAHEKFQQDGVYFEIFRRKRTGEIDYNIHDLGTLSYEISNKLPIRGE